MKAEKQYKEIASRVIQPSKGRGRYIIDNRLESRQQGRMIDYIQNYNKEQPLQQKQVYTQSAPIHSRHVNNSLGLEKKVNGVVRVIQRCFLCGDRSCINGEKCGRTKDFDGLLPPGTIPWSVKYYDTQQGHGGQPNEWEHVVPGAAYRGAGMGGHYSSDPVVSVPIEVHRGGVKGAGGGISSTGSSSSATIWSKGLAEELRQNRFDIALQKAAMDGILAAAIHKQDLFAVLGGYMEVVYGHVERGHITDDEAVVINHVLFDFVCKIQERPDLYGIF